MNDFLPTSSKPQPANKPKEKISAHVKDASSCRKVKPRCPIFGECGGCQYQDISYKDELKIKEAQLKNLFSESEELKGFVSKNTFAPIAASPKQYNYRNRLDMKLLKTRDQKVFMGFSPVARYSVVETDACDIAIKPISDFLPELKKQATEKLPQKYRNASLVVRTGDDGRVFWGGIGKRSLRMDEKDYFWTSISGKKIYYSLDTFFQANLSILPKLISTIKQLKILDKETTFYDLYGGVGFFGVSLYNQVKDVVLVEENIHATKIADYNVKVNGLSNFTIFSGRMEEHFAALPKEKKVQNKVAMIDPPRAGLSQDAAKILASTKAFNSLLYLSCNPGCLVRDLAIFTGNKWKIARIIPFDFFPRTKHLETLVLLKK